MKIVYRINPKGHCPVAFMTEIAKKEEGNIVQYYWTKSVLSDVCLSPGNKKIHSINFVNGEITTTITTIEWTQSKGIMLFMSTNGGETLTLCFADTEKFKFERPDNINVNYIIDSI